MWTISGTEITKKEKLRKKMQDMKKWKFILVHGLEELILPKGSIYLKQFKNSVWFNHMDFIFSFGKYDSKICIET